MPASKLPPVQSAPADAAVTSRHAVPRQATRIVIKDDVVEFEGHSGSSFGMQSLTSGPLELELNPPPDADAQLAEHINRIQKKLVGNVSKALEASMSRLGSAFNIYMGMNVAVFVVGLGSFVLAAWKGLDDPSKSDAIVSAAFGGLSAITFLGYFISRPLAAVASAGAEMAWVLATVNTYWTKLVYLNDTRTVVAGLEAAQRDFEKSMAKYLEAADFQGRASGRSEDPKSTAGATGASGATGATGAAGVTGASGAAS